MAAVYVAMAAFLNLNLHGGRITESTALLNSLIASALLIAVGIRWRENRTSTAALAVVADSILLTLAVETVVADSLWETLKNVAVEPVITLTLLCMALLVWDWVRRFKKIKLKPSKVV